jgi:amidase
MPIKELNLVEGWPTTFGSLAFEAKPQEEDDPVVARLREAGFNLFGMTTSPEFGSVSVTESRAHGATRNPWDPGYTPGGSSGGSAAAVAAGMAPIASGSDGGGSIREPASYTGLVGLKPSRARVPELVSGLLASEGALTRTVADTAAVLDIIGRPDRLNWYTAPPPERTFLEAARTTPQRLRVAVSLKPGFDVPVSKEAREAAANAAEILESLGHEVFESNVPDLDQEAVRQDFDVLWRVSIGSVPIEDWSMAEPHNAKLHDEGVRIDAPTYLATVRRMQIRARSMLAAWGRDFDVLLTPTNPIGPRPVGWLWEGATEDPLDALHRAYRMAGFTALFNMLGLPAISLPLYRSESGLPLGAQLVAGPWEDAGLLSLSAQVEEAAPWAHRKPELAA